MPLKGQKFKKYSVEEKEKIIEEYGKGISSTYLEKEYRISNNTIRQWKYKLRKNGTLLNKKKGRIPDKNLTKEDWILFYNTTKLKSKVKKKRKTYTKKEKEIYSLFNLLFFY